MSALPTALTPEIVAFVKESRAPAKVAGWYDVVNEVQTPVTVRFLDLIGWGMNEVRSPLAEAAEPAGTPRDVMIGFLRRVESGQTGYEVINYLSRSIGRVHYEQSQLSCILCLLVLKKREAKLREIIARVMAAFVLQRSLPEIKRLNEVPATRTPAINRSNPFVSILAASFSRQEGSPGLTIGIDAPALYDTLQNSFSPKWRLPEATSSFVLGPERVRFSEVGEHAKSLRLSKDGGQVTTFFAKYPDLRKLIPVTKRSV